MIPVRETKPGVFEPIVSNPVLLSKDGEVRAPANTVLASSWTNEERAKFGVFLAEPASVPEGKRQVGAPSFVQRDGKVIQVLQLEDIPVFPEPTPADLVNSMLSAHGLTLEELRKVLSDAAAREAVA